MEDSKKPSLDKVIEKLEGLDIREWQCNEKSYCKFVTRIGPLKFLVYQWADFHQISISDRSERLFLQYFNRKKKSVEEIKIRTFYNNLCERYDEHCKKEFENDLEEIFSD